MYDEKLCIMPECPYCPACEYGYIDYPDPEDLTVTKWYCLYDPDPHVFNKREV